MKSSWKSAKLGEFIEILPGFAFKSKDFLLNGVPVVKISNVTPPCVSLEKATYVSEEIADQHSDYILRYGDVLIAMTGSHVEQWSSAVGRVARVRYNASSLLNQRVGKVVIRDTSKADLDFIYYFLIQDIVRKELATGATGSASQANISPDQIKNLEIPRLELNTQKQISSILSALDKKIAINKAINKNLPVCA